LGRAFGGGGKGGHKGGGRAASFRRMFRGTAQSHRRPWGDEKNRGGRGGGGPGGCAVPRRPEKKPTRPLFAKKFFRVPPSKAHTGTPRRPNPRRGITGGRSEMVRVRGFHHGGAHFGFFGRGGSRGGEGIFFAPGEPGGGEKQKGGGAPGAGDKGGAAPGSFQGPVTAAWAGGGGPRIGAVSPIGRFGIRCRIGGGVFISVGHLGANGTWAVMDGFNGRI